MKPIKIEFYKFNQMTIYIIFLSLDGVSYGCNVPGRLNIKNNKVMNI